jgi:hypothetical protein
MIMTTTDIPRASQLNTRVFGELVNYRKKGLGPTQILRIHDALLTRLSNDDDPERSLSTFAKEMTTSGMILSEFLLIGP